MMKKLTAILLTVVLALSLISCQSAPQNTTINIIYTTDVHGNIVTDEYTIGLDVISAIKKNTPNPLLLDAGDFLHGKPVATLTKGADIVSLMKDTGYFATAVGNHEFNYGLETLLERAGEAAAEPNVMYMLSANVKASDGAEIFKPWATTTVGGVKIGVFGVTIEETRTKISLETAARLSFEDAAVSASNAVAALKKEKCDIIIALTHVGTHESSIYSTDIARDVDGIDVIIDGHSHVVLDERADNGTIIVSSGRYGENMGLLELTVEKGKIAAATNRLLSKEDTLEITPDPDIAAKIGDIQSAQSELLLEVVANTAVDLIGERELVRTRETNLGNLTADAVRNIAGADIGFINGGNIRITLKAGDITKGDILTVFPFSNTVVTKKLTGAQVKEVLEHSVSKLPDEGGLFLQISGLIMEVNAANPVGGRVVSVTLPGGAPLDDNAGYIVATNDYIGGGGDGYELFAEIPALYEGQTLEEAFIKYVTEKGTADYGAAESTRILFVEED